MECKCPQCGQQYRLDQMPPNAKMVCLECGTEFDVTAPQSGQPVAPAPAKLSPSADQPSSQAPAKLSPSADQPSSPAPAKLPPPARRSVAQVPPHGTTPRHAYIPNTPRAPKRKSHAPMYVLLFCLLLTILALGVAGYWVMATRSSTPESAPVPLTFEEKHQDLILQIKGQDIVNITKRLKDLDVNEMNAQGQTLLWQAVETGNCELVQLFLNAGFNLQARDKSRETVLLMAARQNDLKMLQFLIKQGAKPPQGYDTDTLWGIAAEHGYLKLILWLKSNRFDFCENPDMESAIYRALAGKYYECVHELLTFYPKETYKDKNGNTLSMIALRAGDYDFFEKTFQESQLNYVNSQGYGLLYCCCLGGNIRALNTLLERNPPLQDYNFKTSPLQAALLADNIPAIDLLLSKGIAITGIDANGNNAPMLAALRGNDRAYDLLQEKGNFDVFHENQKGENIYDLSLQSNNPALAATIKQRLIKTIVQRLAEKLNEVPRIPLSAVRDLLAKYETRYGSIQELKVHFEAVKEKLQELKATADTQALTTQIINCSNRKDYSIALHEIEKAIKMYPDAKNIPIAQEVARKLTQEIAREKAEAERLRQQQEQKNKLRNESQSTIRNTLTKLIENWLNDMKFERDTSDYWCVGGSTLYNVRDWEILGAKNGWDPYWCTVIISINSTNKGGMPIRNNWKVTFVRNEKTNLKWKIFSMED